MTVFVFLGLHGITTSAFAISRKDMCVNELISTGKAARRLGLRRVQDITLALFDSLPHIYIAATGTHLFPAAYIDAWARALQGETPKAPRALAFARTDVAQQLIREAQARIEEALASQHQFTQSELAVLLCLNPSTVNNWRKRQIFSPPAVRIDRKTFVIQSRAIRNLIQWRLP